MHIRGEVIAIEMAEHVNGKLVCQRGASCTNTAHDSKLRFVLGWHEGGRRVCLVHCVHGLPPCE